MSRLLLVDDHPVVRAGYQRLLEQDGDLTVVAQAGTVNDACALFAQYAPDLTITDLAMPGSGGLELIRRLRASSAGARVLVFSMHDSDMLVRRAQALGACGFVAKTSPPEQLLEAARNAIDGRQCFGTASTPRRSSSAADAASTRNLLDTLTPREFEVFRLLARGESLAECARCLHRSPKTIANQQSLIKEKLGITTSAAMAHLAIRHGVITTDVG